MKGGGVRGCWPGGRRPVAQTALGRAGLNDHCGNVKNTILQDRGVNSGRPFCKGVRRDDDLRPAHGGGDGPWLLVAYFVFGLDSLQFPRQGEIPAPHRTGGSFLLYNSLVYCGTIQSISELLCMLESCPLLRAGLFCKFTLTTRGPLPSCAGTFGRSAWNRIFWIFGQMICTSVRQ
ncbi:hypothetical protein VTK26DRAFT_3803 [Humicola hyalothermophila]